MASAVTIRDLTKSYGRIEALRGVSFDAQRGEIFGIIGPDGAGKTTLFRILTTLLLPDSGRATVDGLDVAADYKQIRRRVGYMPGRFSLYQDMSVEENLRFFATLFGTTIEANYDLIRDIYSQIEPFRTRRAGALSGGMKQKLALSCALIHKPSVLFLDEPTTGVDPVSRKELWEMLAKLRCQGITILVSTPYMDEASRCDRIALIRGGRFLDIDTPKRIIEKFGERLWAVSGDRMPAMLTTLRRHPQITSAFAFGDTHHATPDATLTEKQLAAYLTAEGYRNLRIEAIEPGIEDCYMKLDRTNE